MMVNTLCNRDVLYVFQWSHLLSIVISMYVHSASTNISEVKNTDFQYSHRLSQIIPD